MFTLQPKPTFEAEVSIPVPGGKPAKVKFILKHKSKSALKDFYASLTSVDGEGRQDNEALLDLVEDWKGVDQPFSPENLAVLVDNYPAAARAIFDAYHGALFEAREKN